MTYFYRLERQQFIPRPREEVFDFFSDAKNLERITPAFLHFHVRSPPPTRVFAGMLIDYRLRLCGIPLHWQSRIERFEPQHCFSDVQVRGPYRRWIHVHTFDDAPSGTNMIDQVDYAIPLGALRTLAHLLFVNRMLRQIFAYRAAAVDRLFGGPLRPVLVDDRRQDQ